MAENNALHTIPFLHPCFALFSISPRFRSIRLVPRRFDAGCDVHPPHPARRGRCRISSVHRRHVAAHRTPPISGPAGDPDRLASLPIDDGAFNPPVCCPWLKPDWGCATPGRHQVLRRAMAILVRQRMRLQMAKKHRIRKACPPRWDGLRGKSEHGFPRPGVSRGLHLPVPQKGVLGFRIRVLFAIGMALRPHCRHAPTCAAFRVDPRAIRLHGRPLRKGKGFFRKTSRHQGGGSSRTVATVV